MEVEGAEACVRLTDEKAVKKRHSKDYRHDVLDSKIIRERTDREARNTRRAVKYGVNAPEVEKLSEDTLEFERIKGEAWKESEKVEAMKSVGENVALMHENQIIHGDLTTSNIIINDGEAFIIDFGLSELSERVEDMAVDIHLLKQVLESSHPSKSGEAWKSFLEGYREYERYDDVLERLEEVESRGRYK